MRSPVAALTWEIWVRNRKWVLVVIGIVLSCWLLNLLLPARFHTADGSQARLNALSILMFVSLLLTFSIFSYTEFNPQKESIGFPHRLFTLPVSSLLLVTVPIALGLAFVEMVYLAWAALVFHQGEITKLAWSGVLLGSYMVTYQSMLWMLGELGSVRMIALGLTGIFFITVAFLPSFPPEVRAAWMTEQVLIPVFIGWTLIAFIGAWIYVTHERYGGGAKSNSTKALIEQVADALPRRKKPFRSPSAAQFWFEWRRSGVMLPLFVAGLLVVVLGPLSWRMMNDAVGSFRILVAALAMPVVLALPVGKAFSKPDFWSSDISFPSFIAVRPLTTDDLVAIKLKVAALSTAVSWLLVLAFLAVWLPLWANLDSINMVRLVLWSLYAHSFLTQYAIAILSIVLGLFLTWRFLVGSLWLGMSGNGRLFGVTAVPYVFFPFVGLIGTLILIDEDESILSWIYNNLDRFLPSLVWIAAVAAIMKFWIAVYSWRNVTRQRSRQYLTMWLGGTSCLVALAILLWAGLRYFLPADAYRLRSLMLLAALLIIPFARIGLASAFLSRNRHG